MVLTSLVRKYCHKGVLIDANLLIGYLVGTIHPRHLAICRATTKYFGEEDFPLLDRFLAQFDRIITTPHVLTEVSNLAGRLPDSLHTEFRLLFRVMIGRFSEQFKSSQTVSEHNDFLRFGLTDTAISMIAPSRYLVLTDDVALYGLLTKRKVDVINFNYVRLQSWQK